jgi:hypothetical protein
MNPEHREINYRSLLSVLNTRLMPTVQLRGLIEAGKMIPIVITKNFDVYYGAKSHDEMTLGTEDG